MVCDYLCIQVNGRSGDFCRVAKLGRIYRRWIGGVQSITSVQLELCDFTGGEAYEILNVVVNMHGKMRLGAVRTSVV